MSEVSGTFRIVITGEPVSPGKEKQLIIRVSELMRKIDHNVHFGTKHFGRIAYEVSWAGIPRNFGDANAALKFLKEDVGKYLKDWTTDIKMELKESG